VLAGVLGTRHEANVSHVVDPVTGEIHHASAHQLGRHTSEQSDFHPVSSQDAEVDVCPISAALHQAADTTVARATIVAPQPVAQLAALAPPLTTTTVDVYRLAPKTSPPALV
jgi:hypothetical protein